MARLNIEESLLKDDRFTNLCIYFGDKQKALGSVVWAFFIAQECYLDESTERMIPLKKWADQGCSDAIINCGLAKIIGNYVYVVGSEKQFEWLLKCSEAGKTSARNKQKRKLNLVQPPINGVDTSSNLSQPLYSLLSTLNSKKEEEASAAVVKTTSTPTTFNAKNFAEVLGMIPETTKVRWLELYNQEEDFIQRELTKALGFYFENPAKKPKSVKGWLRALSSWLERGWGYRAKNTAAATKANPHGYKADL